MFTLVSVFIFIAAVLLVLIVLVQNSKGGGLASNFAGSNQVMGVRKTADFLEKATWTLAGSLIILSVLAAAAIPRENTDVKRSLIEEQIERSSDPSALPSFPMSLPEPPAEKETPKKD